MTKRRLNFMRNILLSLVLMTSLMFSAGLEAKAADTDVDLVGDSSVASTGIVRYGISSNQTGYLCYLLTADGNAVSGTSAYAFRSPGFSTISAGGDPVFRATSRKGGYVAINWSGTAPWGCSPFTSDRATNAEAIRDWMKALYSEDISNAAQFVGYYWGTTCSEKFISGDYILVIETIMHFRYSFDYTYKDLSLSEWEIAISSRFPGMPSEAATGMARGIKAIADRGTLYRAPFNRPIIGTVRDCLAYKDEVYASVCASNPFIDIRNSNLFSRYLNNVACYAERIGSGSAGERAGFVPCTKAPGTRLSDSEVRNYGVAMLVISALEGDLAGGSPIITDDPPTSGYDGTLYTLTSAGGSSSRGGGSSGGLFSGGGEGAETYLGSGYSSDRCVVGDLYAENCASGDEPYALADRMKSGMSYDGSVPAVVFSGTSYDVNVDNSMGIIPSMLTVDPSTFPFVEISSSPESSYTSYLSAIKASLSPSVSLCYNGRTEGTYSGGSLESSPVIGGNPVTQRVEITMKCRLSQGNSSSSADTALTWEPSGDYAILCATFGKAFYNNSSCTADSGKAILENTDLMRAFRVSSEEYISGIRNDGTLQEYWEMKFENYCETKGNAAGNTAVATWKLSHPEPLRVDFDTEDEYTEAHDTWNSERQSVFNSAHESEYNRVYTSEAGTFTCTYTTRNNGQMWVFNFYYCTPIMQRLYSIHDKIPINDGPSRGSELWDEAWRVTFNLNIANTALLSEDVLSRMIVYMPLAGRSSTTVGSVTAGDVESYVSSAHIPNIDFLIPDATSMDMR